MSVSSSEHVLNGDENPVPSGVAAPFGREVLWTLTSRGVAAALQVIVLVLLARNLAPREFAFVASAIAFLMVTIAVNGFGLGRQIEYDRSVRPDHPELGKLFAQRLRYSYASAVLWILVCMALALVTHDDRFWVLVPCSFWLLAEQTTQVWNGVAVVDGRSKDLLPSYVCRRGPVVLVLLLAEISHLPALEAWVVGLIIGSVLSVLIGWPIQEPWAQKLSPTGSGGFGLPRLDQPFWWNQVGDQLRDLDVFAISMISSTAAGVYAFPTRFLRPLNMVTEAGSLVAFPRIARRDSVGRGELLRGVLLGSVPVVVAASAFAAAAPLVPRLIGDAYSASIEPMRILAIAAVLYGPTSLFTMFLLARDERARKASGVLTLVGGVAVPAAAFAGAHYDGAAGGAWGVTLASFVMLLVLGVRAVIDCRPPADPAPTGSVEDLPKVQERLYALLGELDRVSRESGLRYFVAYGTALGAGREGYMIPWDVDVDVLVPQEEYAALCRALTAGLPPSMELHSPETHPEYEFTFARVCFKGVDHKFLRVDLFPLSAAPDSKLRQWLLIKTTTLINMCFMLKRLHLGEMIHYTPRKRAVARMAKVVLFPLPAALLLRVLRRLQRPCVGNPLVVNSCGSPIMGEYFDASWFGEPRDVRFGELTVRAPTELDLFLTHVYGADFKTPVDAEQQEAEKAFAAKYYVGPLQEQGVIE